MAKHNIFERTAIVNKALEFLGIKESDGSHNKIVDLYNEIKPLPRGYRVKYSDSWCATFVSVIFNVLGFGDYFPLECGCGPMIEKAKKMHIWVEDDKFIPDIGDVILYDWQDSGKGDNIGEPDHVGVVTEVYKSYGYVVVTEGNYKDSVKKRTIDINGKYIRGYITPNYDGDGTGYIVDCDSDKKKSISEIAHEVIAGKWGTGSDRKDRLEVAGYDYNKVQKKVNQILNTPSKETVVSANMKKEVNSTVLPTMINRDIKGSYKTSTDLYLRNGAGTNKKALVLMPKGTVVQNYGYYSINNGNCWYYVNAVIEGVKYTGFCHSSYLKSI